MWPIFGTNTQRQIKLSEVTSKRNKLLLNLFCFTDSFQAQRRGLFETPQNLDFGRVLAAFP